MKPKAIVQPQLVRVLRDMADRVEAGDSFEGTITYAIPSEEDERALQMLPLPDREHAFMVQASYRVGNSQGQGGVSMIGTL